MSVGSASPRRRRLLSSVAAAVALVTLLWWLLPVGSDSTPRGRVVLSTGVPTGVYERYGTLLRADLRRDLPEVEVELLHSQGSVDNLHRVAAGKASFAIATADAAASYAADGGKGAERLRACARLYDDYVQLVVPQGSPVRSAADLAGRRVGVGEDRSGVQLISRRLLTAAGLDLDTDIRAQRVGIDRMTRLMREGELDAFFWSGGLPTKALQDLVRNVPVRLVPLSDLAGPLHRQGERTRYYRAAVMPPDAYPWVQRGEAIKTIAVANLLVTTEDADAELTEAITRTVIRSRDRIGEEVHAAQKVDLRTAVFTDPLPLHEGAARYYRSVKP
ncbi:TAXI family TRAP transporter solute-binding subunit [Streptomyces pactum]|uniref:TAXI family TRAP transporter solute-binding subunit n=1 Tax=Streptomyces pactum TaxID=68249 RepID=A0ABS0NQM4_9ACTN|nr:TAXI family TRAP transporter solute-binding subunit [Streptomyces pactum]MBH5337339.1 TAXI family TRAP transporter solute-binding subunit [Streptomyces pactum]